MQEGGLYGGGPKKKQIVFPISRGAKLQKKGEEKIEEETAHQELMPETDTTPGWVESQEFDTRPNMVDGGKPSSEASLLQDTIAVGARARHSVAARPTTTAKTTSGHTTQAKPAAGSSANPRKRWLEQFTSESAKQKKEDEDIFDFREEEVEEEDEMEMDIGGTGNDDV